MDVYLINLNEWYEWTGAYILPILPAWIHAMRRRTHWILKDDQVVAKWKGTDAEVETFMQALFWPLFYGYLGGYYLKNGLSNSRIVNGKPPKDLLAKAHELKVDKLLED